MISPDDGKTVYANDAVKPVIYKITDTKTERVSWDLMLFH